MIFFKDSSVVDSLTGIAKKRTDIFGAMGETGIGRQIDEEQKKPNSEIGWDGHKRTGKYMCELFVLGRDSRIF